MAASEQSTPAPSETLVTETPSDHSEVGALADGFPTDLLPLPDDAVILVTFAEPIGDADVQEVSLNLTTQLSTAEVVDLYRTALTDAGFEETVTDETSVSAEVTFVRSGGDEQISVGVIDQDGSRTVSVGGRVRGTEDEG